jgi:nucleoside-diphosphate-sugar epimerase
MNERRLRLVVTGSKGLLGSYVMDYARAQGADLLGVDVVGRGNFSDYINADLTDLGQTYGVLRGADAVIHLAAINAQRIFPAARTFMTNIASTYNVFLACAHLGIRRVVVASTIQVNHSCTPRTPIRYQYFPFDEEHPVDPQDEYSLSKYAGEICADTFARHEGLTIVSLRFTGAEMPKQLVHLAAGEEPDVTSVLYTYVDPRDAARACYLAATVPLPAGSHTVALITARDHALDMPSIEFARRYYPDTEIRDGLEGYNSFISGVQAAQVLGFTPEYSCRDQATSSL